MPFILHFIDDGINTAAVNVSVQQQKKYEIKTNKSEAVENSDSFDGIVNSTQAKR